MLKFALQAALWASFLLTSVTAKAEDDFLSQWFAIPALFVVFRETLEATVLVAVLVQYLRRAGQKQLESSVWWGAACGGAASFLIGAVLLSIYYATTASMDAKAASLVEASMLLFASVVITYFFVTHLAPGMKTNDEWTSKWERKMGDMVDDALNGKDPRNFFILTFTTVLREGIEAVIFIIGIGAIYTPVALILPCLAGIFVGCLFGGALFAGSAKLDMSMFFIASAGFLLLVSAGLAAHSSYEFQKAEVFGTWACIADDDLSPTSGVDFGSYRRLTTERAASCDGVGGEQVAWVNKEVWDATGCCDTRDNLFFFLAMVLFWYRPAPTNLELLVYVAYVVITLGWGYGVVATIKDGLKSEASAKVSDEKDGDAEAGEGTAIESSKDPNRNASGATAIELSPLEFHGSSGEPEVAQQSPIGSLQETDTGDSIYETIWS